MNDITTRQCRVCGKVWPLTPDYFAQHNVSKVFYRKCNACRLKRWKPPTGRPSPEPGYKRCSKCENDFLETREFFIPDKGCKNGLRPECRGCARPMRYAAERKRLSNPVVRKNRLEKQRESYPIQNAKKRGNPYYLEKRRDEQRRHIDRYLTYNKAWKKRNPERVRIYQSKRRAMVKNAPGGNYKLQDIQKLKQLQSNKCWWCGKELVKYEIDHRIPLFAGGTNYLNNLVLSCCDCNRKKWVKMPYEFNGRLL